MAACRVVGGLVAIQRSSEGIVSFLFADSSTLETFNPNLVCSTEPLPKLGFGARRVKSSPANRLTNAANHLTLA